MTEFNETQIQVVLARLSTLPPTIKIHIGDKGSYTKEELMRHVLSNDEIGNLIIKMHLNYMKEIVKGTGE